MANTRVAESVGVHPTSFPLLRPCVTSFLLHGQSFLHFKIGVG
jgi:hypothetical protein